jgi:hypothetical protein
MYELTGLTLGCCCFHVGLGPTRDVAKRADEQQVGCKHLKDVTAIRVAWFREVEQLGRLSRHGRKDAKEDILN